jgi:transposase
MYTMSFIRRIKRNERVYLAEVENVRVDGKVVQRHIRYVGREVDGKAVLNSDISDIAIDEVKVYGPLLILNEIAKSIGLHDLLGSYANEILSMVYAHCIDYRSLNQMKKWYDRTDLNFILDLASLTEARLVGALDALESLDPTEIQSVIFDRVRKAYGIRNKGIVYDVTNTYLYGRRCPLGRFGKDKEARKGYRLIQVGLGVTQKDGIPVFHKVYNGNIHDARTFSDSITEFKRYGIDHGVVIFDRGITSKHNQTAIFELEWKVICGLPLDVNLKQILRRTKNEQEFLQFNNRVKLNSTTFYVVSQPHEIDGVHGKLAFCFNEHLKKEIKESRYDEIENAKQLLAQGKKIKPELTRFFSRSGRLLIDRLDQAAEFDGYSCIFTTESFTDDHLVRTYFDKDLVEKAFQSLKGIIKLRPIRHWLYNRVIAHVFICYLAYLLLALLKMKLRDLNISPITALRELEGFYKIYARDSKKNFTFTKTVALTKLQENILKAVDKKLLSAV